MLRHHLSFAGGGEIHPKPNEACNSRSFFQRVSEFTRERHGGTGRRYILSNWVSLTCQWLFAIKLWEGLAKMFHFLGGMLFFFNRKRYPRKRRIHHLNHLETHQIQPLQRNFPQKKSSNALGRPQKSPPFVEGLLGQKSFWGRKSLRHVEGTFSTKECWEPFDDPAVLIIQGLLLEGLNPKNRGQRGTR